MILLIPTFLMGITTPLLMEIVRERVDSFGKTLGVFYGANVLGAALGALVTGLVLIELGGLSGSISIASVGNYIAGTVVLITCYHVQLEKEAFHSTGRKS